MIVVIDLTLTDVLRDAPGSLIKRACAEGFSLSPLQRLDHVVGSAPIHFRSYHRLHGLC